MHALPQDWQICFHESQVIYYVNTKTKCRQWDHPLDAEYKKLVDRARRIHPNTDLSEETSQLDSGIKSLQGTENSEVLTDLPMDNYGSGTGNRFLAPIERKGVIQLDTIRNNRFEVTNYANTAGIGQIDLNIKTEEFRKPLNLLANQKNDKEVVKGLTLSGTGSMFLKSNLSKKLEDKSNAKQQDFDWGNSNTFSGHSNSNVKGILRDSSLTDIRNKNPINRLTDIDIEDRKSVRFDLERLTKIENRDSSEDEYDEWDFMENEGVKDVNVTLNKNVAPKVTLLSQQSLDDDRKPSNRLASLNRTLSSDGGADSKPLQLATMFDRQKIPLTKPLYEDTDSESGGGSVIGISKGTLIKTNKFDGEVDEMMEKEKFKSEMKERLERFKQNLLEQEQAEKRRLNDEMQKRLQQLKQEKNNSEVKYENDAMQVERSLSEKRLEEMLAQEKENLKKKFETQQSKLEEEHQNELTKLAEGLQEQIRDLKIELESQHNFEVEKFSQRLKDEFQSKTKEIGNEHRSAVEILQRNHAEILQDLERDLKSEEEILKKDHTTNLAQLKDKLTHELELERQRMRETGESHLFEKMRCEKRLLEDKYRCLKEKYVRLKADVKISLERRSRRRDHQSLTTGSETERSNSNKQSVGSSDIRSTSVSGPHLGQGRPPTAPPTPNLQIMSRDQLRDKSVEKEFKDKPTFGAAAKYLSHLQHYHDDTTSISQSDTTVSNNFNRARYLPIQPTMSDNGNSESEAFSRNKENNNVARDTDREQPGRQRKKLFTRAKSASTSRLNSFNRSEPPRPCTPVENLRRQLQKLEDLEDQFPDNTLDTTYHLRYPFTDVSKEHAGSSSELEFFKHRIHLERDSVRRAKDSLRTQRTNFRARQREIKLRHKSTARHTLDQLIQEEKELTEMEVNLHRTRALLGEKVIRLRHLEQSLKRVYEKEKAKELSTDDSKTRKDDATISDLSSHSSSGFSSTDIGSDTNHEHVNRQKEMYQESSDIIQSLEHLNSEIREIWEILSKQQAHGLPPPPSMTYSDINWPHMMPAATTSVPQQIVQQSQPIPTLADRLETYRQLAANRNSPATAAPTSGIMSTLAANMIVSQSPLASGYTTSLVERTQDLRNWLRLAKNEHELLSSGQQANL
ncbi:hypothetical protein Bhyg_14276 [Pseudolycoriella hygida]|uniref:WW domain-containing protein n=1 Tax=Pseudolycoriella hygida TaxID=35572 RepID=A0A9Q0MPH7_9DIPT|nr:hypothetical protein Bhyg_14276 [Pseudolycoriella hygida]